MSEFWLMNGRELQKVFEGVQLNHQREWERTRTLAYFVINKNVKASRQVALHKVLSFPWDRKTTRRPPTAQETKDLIERWDRFKKN
jgi:hypothetical protein